MACFSENVMRKEKDGNSYLYSFSRFQKFRKCCFELVI